MQDLSTGTASDIFLYNLIPVRNSHVKIFLENFTRKILVRICSTDVMSYIHEIHIPKNDMYLIYNATFLINCIIVNRYF